MTATGVVSSFAVVMTLTNVDVVAVAKICQGHTAFPFVLDLATNIAAGFCWHSDKPAAFARSVAAARIVSGFAVVVTFTLINAVAMDQIG